MIIVEKNPGQKIDYEVNKTKLTFDDDLTLNLAKREEDYAVHIDVCFDEDGALCIGAAAGRSYVAQIDIPPRQYKEVPATAAKTTTNGRVRITNSTSNVGKYGKVTGWISVDDAKAGAGLRDQTTDSRGLTKIVIDYASNVQAMAVYNLAQQLDLVAPGYYRSRYIDAAKTAQYIEIGQISAGDAEHVTTLCKKAAIEYKTAA